METTAHGSRTGKNDGMADTQDLRARFVRAAQAYESMRDGAGMPLAGQLPATWEVIYAHAWGPPPGAPIRVGGVDEVHVPASAIHVRKR